MNNNNTTYHPLGDYIRPVDIRNRDLQVTKLLGLSIEKCFIPSIANTIGTDMSTYKVVMPGQFAYGPVTSRNGDKITIALYTGDEPAIISQAYSVFEIVGECDTVETRRATSLQLLPEYLMMWFRRPEFDRYARYHSHGSAREIFDWAEMCATMVPVPPISEQRAVVADYEAVARRISVAKRTIATLQATAQTLYRKMFVDGIDKENLPEGWRWGKFTDVIKISGGGTPSTSNTDFWNNEIMFFTPTDVSDSYYTIKTEKHISRTGLQNCSSKLYGKNTTFVTARGTVGALGLAGENMAMNQSCYALLDKEHDNYFYIHQLSIFVMETLKKEAVGAIFSALVTSDFDNAKIIIPTADLMKEYNDTVSSIYDAIFIRQEEIEKLTEIQTIILSGMGR